MKRSVVLFAAVSLIAGLATPTVAKVHVVTTLTEIGALVREIGGDRIEVYTLAKGNEDPHVLPAKPSHSRRMMDADLLVYNGLQLEVGWLPLLLDGARNPKIRPGQPGHLDLSTHVEPLEVPQGDVDRSQGDVHPEGNPHYSVDPAVYPELARAVAERLAAIDPAGSAAYETRRADFEQRWEAKLSDWKRRLAFLDGVPVITYHKQWEYLARTFGFRILANVEDRPGIPAGPRHIADLERVIREQSVQWILDSDLTDPGNIQKLAARSGCKVLVLPQAVDSRDGTGDLVSWFEALVAVFERAHRGGS